MRRGASTPIDNARDRHSVPVVAALPDRHSRSRRTSTACSTDRTSRWAGTRTPFAERREAAIDIDFDALPLKEYVAYLPDKARIDLADGALTTRLKVVVRRRQPGERKLEVRGDAPSRRARAEAPRRIVAGRGRSNLAWRSIASMCSAATFASRRLAVDAPAIDVRRLADGRSSSRNRCSTRPARRDVTRPADGATPDAPWAVTWRRPRSRRAGSPSATKPRRSASSLADVASMRRICRRSRARRRTSRCRSSRPIASPSFKGEADVEPLVPRRPARSISRSSRSALLFPYYKDALAVDVQKGSLDLRGALRATRRRQSEALRRRGVHQRSRARLSR